MPKISIIMPTYNGARFVADAIESALNQTFKDFELIVVNDGSTDNTEEIVKAYQKKDHRIRYFYKPNGGVAKAYNFGIRRALGEYISVFEHDDISMPERLENQIEILDRNKKITLVYSQLQTFNDYNSLGGIYSPPYDEPLMSIGGCFRRLIISGCFCNNASVTFRREISESIKYDESLSNHGLGHDLLFFLQASQKFIFYYMKTPLVLWRRGHSSLSIEHMNTFKAEERVIKKLYEGKRQILGITFSKALSMMYIRRARMAITSRRITNKYFVFLLSLVKALISEPLNPAVYKTLVWAFTKRLFKKRKHKKTEYCIAAADYLLSFGK